MGQRVTRRVMVGGAAAVAGMLRVRPTRAQSAQYVFKVGTDNPTRGSAKFSPRK